LNRALTGSYDRDEFQSSSHRRAETLMCPLRLVADDRAGPTAVGILVPPARRTCLIVRPRSLSFDLLVLAEARGTTFREFDHEQAGRAAEALFDAFVEWSERGFERPADAFESAPLSENERHLRIHVGPFHLIACERRPGQAYAPIVFPDLQSFRAAAEALAALLRPSSGIEQEFYLNTRHFQR
jgi:hypothetical protein